MVGRRVSAPSSTGRVNVAEKARVVVDPHFRKMQEIFSPTDLAQLHRTVEVVWERDERLVQRARR
jgi:hypothetical protein